MESDQKGLIKQKKINNIEIVLDLSPCQTGSIMNILFFAALTTTYL
jgi:hypothetical protein